MAVKRPVDVAVNNFLKAMGGVVALLVGLQIWIFIVQDQGPNEAYIWAWLGTFALTGGVLWLMKRRPRDAFLTWGEAMAAATYVFALMFLIFGVVPHQWLVYADSELLWRSDRLVLGPEFGFTNGEGFWPWLLPFDLTYLVIRDLIAVLIYGIGLAGLIALWSMWQKRDLEPETTVERSSFGRPLVREGQSEKVGV